jgi:outer membrane protein assembly factor BamB
LLKVVSKVIWGIVFAAGAGTVLAAIIFGWFASIEGEKSHDGAKPAVQYGRNGSDWPMFRGGQSLLGRAAGSLPDSLQVVWKFKTNGEIKSSPAIAGGVVFIGSSDKTVYAIDLATGATVWSYQTGGDVESTPCVIDGGVFVGSSDGFLYALDAKMGSFRWKYETDSKILGAANWVRSPDGKGIWILVGSYDSNVHCVDSASGRAVWTYETDSYVNGSVAVAEGQVVFGGCDEMIHAVSVADSNEASQIDTGSFIAASAAVLEGQAYVGNYDGKFICADIAARKVVWDYGDGESPYFSSAAVTGDLVIFGGRDNRVHCVRRSDGKPVWTFKTLDEVDSSPVICGDKVVVGSEDGRLYMLRLSDGGKVWSYEIGQPVTSSPAVAGGIVVVGSDDGYVYAFGPKR